MGRPIRVASTTSVIGLSPLADRGGVRQWAEPLVRGAAGDGCGLVSAAADARVRWRTLALIAVVVGIGGGVALTAFAGARRTSAAVPQMLAYSRPDDGSAGFGGFCPPPRVTGLAATSLAPLPGAARVLRLPQVAAFMRIPICFISSVPPASTSGAST